MIQLVECPRDAMQGFENFIPTNLKAEYINMLLKVGFHTIDLVHLFLLKRFHK